MTDEISIDEYRALAASAPSKYRNVKVQTEYGTFDSRGEHDYWLYLCQRQLAGEIERLDRQVAFPLLVNGVNVGKYVADYVWWENGVQVVADWKSSMTRRLPIYRLKRRLMLACHNVDVLEVGAA